jgi:hypothetical protein
MFDGICVELQIFFRWYLYFVRSHFMSVSTQGWRRRWLTGSEGMVIEYCTPQEMIIPRERNYRYGIQHISECVYALAFSHAIWPISPVRYGCLSKPYYYNEHVNMDTVWATSPVMSCLYETVPVVALDLTIMTNTFKWTLFEQPTLEVYYLIMKWDTHVENVMNNRLWITGW